MGKKKISARVLIVGDNSEISRIVADSKSLLKCKQTKVKSCEEALEVVTGGSTSFDFIVTDLAELRMDCAKQIAKLSPSSKIVYMIP